MITSIKKMQWQLSSMASAVWTCPKCNQKVYDSDVCGVCGYKSGS